MPSDPTDVQRRDVSSKAILYRLTSAGQKVLSRSDKTMGGVMGAALSGFTAKEITTLRTQLRQLADARHQVGQQADRQFETGLAR